MLKEILTHLRGGGSLVLHTTTNQYGEKIIMSELSFENGRWLLTEVNCMSSWDLGLGTCSCNSHPTWVTEQVSRHKALRLIRDYIDRMEEDESRRQEETAFIDHMIASL